MKVKVTGCSTCVFGKNRFWRDFEENSKKFSILETYCSLNKKNYIPKNRKYPLNCPLIKQSVVVELVV